MRMVVTGPPVTHGVASVALVAHMANYLEKAALQR